MDKRFNLSRLLQPRADTTIFPKAFCVSAADRFSREEFVTAVLRLLFPLSAVLFRNGVLKEFGIRMIMKELQNGHADEVTFPDPAASFC